MPKKDYNKMRPPPRKNKKRNSEVNALEPIDNKLICTVPRRYNNLREVTIFGTPQPDNTITWTTELRRLDEINPYEHNPRTMTEAQVKLLANSLRDTGYAELIAINQDNTIIAGHQRHRILLEQYGAKHIIEVRVPSRQLTEDEFKKYLISSNKAVGDWDYDILANCFDVDALKELGFNDADFDICVDELPTEGEDDVPEIEDKVITVTGDLYELNNHRLLCGDSTVATDYAKLVGKEIPSLMVTDPPYGVSYDPSWRNDCDKGCRATGKVQNDEKVDWTESYSLCPCDVVYVWHAGKYAAEVAKNLIDCGFEIKSQIIWAKQHFALSRGDYHWQHEPCWYAVRKGAKHNWQGSRKETTLWQIANNNAFGGKRDEEDITNHGTQKPVECMRKPIINNTAVGDIVYDPFLGSGTTVIAAELSGRTCYGIEISPQYCDIIVQRYRNFCRKNNREIIVKRNGEIVND